MVASMALLKTLKTRYSVHDPEASPLSNLVRRVSSRTVPTFPRTVQIQTHTGCNAACNFCPYPDSYPMVPKGKMSEELFQKIVAEIGKYGVTRRVSPYLMNEPFLHKGIVEMSRYIKKHVPSCRVVVTTNAGPLKKDLVDDLVRDCPFRAIYVSFQGIDKEAYEQTMGGNLVMEKTMENVHYLIEQRRKHAPELKIVVSMVQTNRIDADKAVAYWQSQGVESKYTALENRGGNIEDFDDLRDGEKRIFKDCTRLFKQAYIMFNGDMVLCCTDYYKTMVLGNCGETSIFEVWNAPRAVGLRRGFINGDLADNPLCANCEIAPLK